MNPIERHIYDLGVAFGDTSHEERALSPPDEDRKDPITLEPLDESPSLLHFDFSVGDKASSQTYRIDNLNEEGFQKIFTNKLFCNCGKYPKTINHDRRIVLGDRVFYAQAQQQVDSMEEELQAYTNLLYSRVGGYNLACFPQVRTIMDLLPELIPSADLLSFDSCENEFRYQDLYTRDWKEVKLSHVYNIDNSKLKSGVQKVYHFVLDNAEKARPRRSIKKIVDESEELALNKQIIDFIRPYLWIMEKVHGRNNMDKSPLVKVSRYAMAYAKRTSNYEKVRKIMWVATNFITILITTLIVAGVIALTVSNINSAYENLSNDGESIWSFLWNWQDRADAATLRDLGWDPAIYYIHRRYEQWGNTIYEYQSVRVR